MTSPSSTGLKTDHDLGVTAPRGFRAGAAAAGIKASGKSDIGVLACDVEAPAAAVFTTNRVAGAPVLVSREHLQSRDRRERLVRAVVVNSGCSNVCTGERGIADAREMAALAARAIGCPAEAVLVASTGVIGRFLPMEKVRSGVAAACARLSTGPEADRAFAEAILTTDTRLKQAGVRLSLGGRTVTIAGATKGVGMIEPAMATTLSFLATDAAAPSDLLQAALGRTVDRTYNCLTIDGHQSTSDTMAILASGRAMEGGPPIAAGSPDAARFEAALEAVCGDLAYQIAADAEGGTKVIEVRVTGAASDTEARRAARAIANSPLVKCAFFGEDPNWGRIISAAGNAGISSGPDSMRLRIGDLVIFERGRPAGADPKQLKAAMHAHDIAVHLDLGAGRGEARYLTCDFSYDYVKINAEYTT
jgi:glutamate N-acetyltransferase/amino-acid N-acetyltransferase